MTSLFSAGPRHADGALPAAASAYARLDADASRHSHAIRAALDRWFARLPGYAQEAIGTAFRRPALGDHLGAFWELYVHELALRLGFEVEVDVGREDPRRRRPDFLLRRGDATVYVESTVIIGDDAVHPSDRTRVDQLYDAIDRIEIRDYLLHVRVVRVGRTTPGRRTIGRLLDRWLRTLDYDTVLALRDTDSPRPKRTFVFDDWAVAIEASAWLPDLRGRDERGVIGSKLEGFGQVADVNTLKHIADVEPIGRELRRKAGWYGELGAPFVIAALCAGSFVTDHDIAQGLIGPIRHTLRLGGRSSGHYEPGGLWFGPDGLRNQRVSGVLTARALRPTGIGVVEPALWTAPKATHPLMCYTPLRYLIFDETAAVSEHSPGRTIADMLGV